MADVVVKAKQIFLGALDCASPEEVAAYVKDACGDDEKLQARVGRLLAARERAGAFLGGANGESTATQPAAVDGARDRIGPYKLIEQIGEGGFGVVFLAEQKRPVKRRVALKVIKPGMDTREVIARFEAERQALALMDHPNIAKVYEAGATVETRPYFVMELIRGVPITEYCDECQLGVRERLELFVVVCRAVQHAHQKGIIHRDLKPTNVLVAIQDGRPTPKIIDFGIAKAIDQQLTDRTLMTAFAQIVGTPLYMSPEQSELSPLGVDTRSDIYSLGVVLYELLTGSTPFDKERLRSSSYDELRRIIREEEPPRPSLRLSTLSAAAASTLATRRRTDRRRLQQAVRGELDWIVMKCLEKDRNRRYDSAGSLARDVERYLADEPVTACPPSAGYRFGKFARRNKGPLAGVMASALVLLLMIVGLVASNRMISAERTQAQDEAAKANEVAALLQDMLAAAHPDSADGKDFTVRELLDAFSSGLGDRLQHQPAVEAKLRQVIGSAYTRLGLVDQAEAHLLRSLELHKQIYEKKDVRVADSQRYLAWNLLERDRANPEVERLAREALAVYGRQRDAERTAEANWLLVLSLDGQEKTPEAEAAAEAALQFARANRLPSHPTVPNLLHQLAWINIRKGDYASAERLARESVELHQRVHGPAHLETAFGWNYHGAALHRQHKYAEAEASYEKSLAIFRRSLPDDHPYVQPMLKDLSWALVAQGKSAELIELWWDVTRRQPDLAMAHRELAWALATAVDSQLRDPDTAVEAARRATQLQPNDGGNWYTLGVAQYRAGNWRESVAALQKALSLCNGSGNDWIFLAMAEWQAGRHDAAREWQRKALEWAENFAPLNRDTQQLFDEARALMNGRERSE